jgi:hypothetical protein
VKFLNTGDMRFPNTLDLNVYRAYISAKCLEADNDALNALNLDWDIGNPDTLRVLCLKSIADNWLGESIKYLIVESIKVYKFSFLVI